MRYEIFNLQGGLCAMGEANNKASFRNLIMSHPARHLISRVRYGKKEYTISDIYKQFPAEGTDL